MHIGGTWHTLTGRRLQTSFVPNDCSDCDQPLICSVVFWKSSLKILVFSPVKYQSEATSSQIHHLQVRILHDKRIPRGGKSYWFSVIAFSSTKLAFQSWQDSQIPEMWIHDVSMVKINLCETSTVVIESLGYIFRTHSGYIFSPLWQILIILLPIDRILW